MPEFLDLQSVALWIAEAQLAGYGTSRYDHWVDYTKGQLMDWWAYCNKHNVCFDVAKLREVLYLENNPEFNKWAELYCDSITQIIEEIK